MEMVDRGDRWSLAGDDAEVTRVCFDWAVTLTVGPVEPQLSVRIESPFVLAGLEGAPRQVDPEGEPSDLAPVLWLVRRRLTRLDALKDGRLDIGFSGGVELTVPVSEEFEAWELTDSAGGRIVSLPGGGTTTWSRVDG
jgi:hypothetical protein